MPIVTPLLDGLRRVLQAPVILVGATVLTMVLALPLGQLLRSEQTGLADSVAGHVSGQVSGQAAGIGRLFTISVIGAATVHANLNALFDGEGQEPAIVAVVLSYIMGWTFLSGGVLDRYARNRPTRSAGFFSACGLYGSRLLRLTVIAGLAYGVLFGIGYGWLCDDLNAVPTRNGTAQGLAFAGRLLPYVVFGCLLGAVNLVVDYARVRAVVEDRRSMIGAVIAGWRFVRRHPSACAGLYAANGLVLGAVMLSFTLGAPVTRTTGLSMWLAVWLGQVYIVARLACRLLFYAAEVSYFQSQLAHAGYVATPTPVWPESSSAEALGRLAGVSAGQADGG